MVYYEKIISNYFCNHGHFIDCSCCGGGGGGSSASGGTPGTGTITADNLTSKTMRNEAAYIPAQCYTATKDTTNNKVYNPCYSCHTKSVKPNFVNDGELQLSYDLPEYANTNRWTNLFVDRTAAVNAISDSEILSYVRNGNYTDSAGNIILAKTLSNVPPDGITIKRTVGRLLPP